MTAIIAFIFVIGVLVFIHELGHFLVAKWSGVRVEKFSLGFGKKLFGFTRGETEYLICLLPLGGYVKMYGEGVEGNFIVDKVDSGSNAERTGFKSGDRIISIDGLELKSFERWKQLEAVLENEPLREFEFVIERDGKNIEITSTAQDLEGSDNYSEKEYPRGFSNQSIINRLLIVVAGPFMNFLLPFILLPIVFMIGISVPAYLERSPVIGQIANGSPAEEAGFLVGDKILEIEGKEVSDWRDVNIELQTNPDVLLDIKVDRGGETIAIPIKATATPEGLVALGFGEPVLAKVGGVMDGTPADNAELEKGDKILEINGQPIADWNEMASVIQKNANKELTMLIERGESVFDIQITPEPLGENGAGAIGIQVYTDEIIKKYGFFESIYNGVKEAANMIIEVVVLLFGFLYKLVTGKIALGAAGKSLAGPILIAKISGAAAEAGFAQLLQFTCFISINLAIINLFPIPMLDGGHVVYLTIEAIKRKPLSQRSLEISQRIGLTVLIFIMFFAIYNDISRVKGDIVNSLSKVVNIFKQ
ncbi:MAG: RIP metalloprotease RseP [Candidatus Dadabacteria bacterium]|nr:RIP metalloprotease RseP [Candidatus Dadabacteria bacterium]